MPSRVDINPPPPANSRLQGIATSLLYNGSRFRGHQKSKGHKYDVEVVLQVCSLLFLQLINNSCIYLFHFLLAVVFIITLYLPVFLVSAWCHCCNFCLVLKPSLSVSNSENHGPIIAFLFSPPFFLLFSLGL